jgi:HEAT repeat protein
MVPVATHLALLAAMSLPQGTDRTPLARHADVLPADALAVVASGSWEDHAATLTASGLDGMLVDPHGLVPRLRRGVLAGLIGTDAPELGVLDGLGASGAALAMLPPDRSGRPGLLASIEASPEQAAALRSGLERCADEDRGVERIQVAGRPGYKVRTTLGDAVLAILDGRVLVGSAAEFVDAAAARVGSGTGDSLARTPHFVQALADGAGQDRALFQGYVALDEVTRWALRSVPAPSRQQLVHWIDATGLGALHSLSMSAGLEDGEIVERFRVGAPQAPGPLLAALLPEGTVDVSGIAQLVPADATSFGLSSLRLHDVFRAVFALLDDETAAQGRAMLAMAGAQLGDVDIERDLLAALGDRMVSVSWPSGDAADSMVIADLVQAARLQGALDRVPFLSASPLAGYRLFLFDGGEEATRPALAVGDGKLIFASSERRLRRWITERRSATANPRVAAMLGGLPPGAIGLGFVDVGATVDSALQGIGAAAAMLPEDLVSLTRGLGRAAAATGTVRYLIAQDDGSYRLAIRSAGGSVLRLLGALLGAAGDASLHDPEIATMLARARSVDSSRTSRNQTLLEAIRAAELARQATDGGFADLDTLVADGRIPAALLDEQVEPGIHRIDDHLVTILLSDEVPAATFIAVIWPLDQRPGELLACTDVHAPQRNDLIARSSGILRPERSDIFFDGSPNGEWTPGWRPLAPAGTAAGAGGGSTDATLFRVLTALEEQGEAGARELVDYLIHDDPLIVARAAWALGRMRHAPAVPALIDLVDGHAEVSVRRHAIGALRALRDPRSASASVRALADDDPMVRSLAAANLGALRHGAAKDALVATLSATTPPNDSTDDRDAIAALLALGDLADAEQLLPAATAFERSANPAQEAVVWVFQQLSPQIDATRESTLLMAVLDHRSTLLRRYAIQRLGELAEPRTAAALEARLATEDDALRPLVEVSLAAVRGGGAETADRGPIDELGATLAPLVARAEATWADPQARRAILIGLGAFVVLMIGFGWILRARRRRRQAENWAAMTRPSADFDARPAGPAPRYEDYDPDAEELLAETEAPIDYASDEEAYEEADEDAWQHDEAARS